MSKPKVTLTNEQKEMCPWLAKIPQHNPNDNSTDANLHLKATFDCYQILWNNPSLALTCHSWLQDRISNSDLVDQDEFFVPEPMMVSNLPLEWVCAYLISMRVGWTEALLGGMKAYDRGQICNLLCGYLNCSPMLKLGKYGGHKLVVKHAFDMRRQSVSPRFASIKSEATAKQSVDEVGCVSFGDVGIYTLVTGADKLAHEVKHQPMRDIAAVTSKHIDESWFMARNFSDSKAVIQMDGSKTVKHLLCDYFGKNASNKEPQLQGKSKVWESLMD